MHNDEQITYFAETDSRNRRMRFGIKAKDRSRHVYVIGKTGMGKSTLLENLAIQDIQNGNGIAFIDPHGKTADLLLEYVPETRIKDVLYFAPFDLDYPVSFNVMEDVGPDKRHLVANGLMSAFKKIWVDAWSARMEYILNNILLALLEYPDSTLLGVNRMLADKDYRNKVVTNITDPSVKSFWVDEFAKYGERYMQEAGAAIQNKIGQFVSNPLIRNIIGQPKSTFDIREMMDKNKILIVNLSKGRMGEANANLLGGMLITKIYLGAMSRADVHDSELQKLPHFYLFVDEFQNFANESFADILSEARKYKLNLTIAHQYIEQMTEEVRAAVFGNVGSMVTFRVGAYDAEYLEKEFAPVFTAEDLVNLDKFQIYLKLMIDGVGSSPFSARTVNNPPQPEINYVSEIIDCSRSTFARPRIAVEEDIMKWHRPIDQVERDSRASKKEAQKEISTRGDRPKQPEPAKKYEDRPAQTRPYDQNQKPKDFSRPREQAPQNHNPFKKVFNFDEAQRERAHDKRETELRNAISLNFLKKEEPSDAENSASTNSDDVKKDKKGITKESLSDLRSTLESVLKEAGVTKQSQPAPQDTNKNVSDNNSQKENPAHAHNTESRRHDTQKNHSHVSQTQAPVVQGLKSSPNKVVDEISEKELKDILGVED